MNAKATEIAEAIKAGSVLTYSIPSMIGPATVEEVTVSCFKGRSVWFTNGSRAQLRSLHTYSIKSI